MTNLINYFESPFGCLYSSHNQTKHSTLETKKEIFYKMLLKNNGGVNMSPTGNRLHDYLSPAGLDSPHIVYSPFTILSNVGSRVAPAIPQVRESNDGETTVVTTTPVAAPGRLARLKSHVVDQVMGTYLQTTVGFNLCSVGAIVTAEIDKFHFSSDTSLDFSVDTDIYIAREGNGMLYYTYNRNVRWFNVGVSGTWGPNIKSLSSVSYPINDKYDVTCSVMFRTGFGYLASRNLPQLLNNLGLFGFGVIPSCSLYYASKHFGRISLVKVQALVGTDSESSIRLRGMPIKEILKNSKLSVRFLDLFNLQLK